MALAQCWMLIRGYCLYRKSGNIPTGGQGIWPAFWMLPSEGPDCTSGEGLYGHWPMSGEIDIMEAVNDMKVTSAAIHFGGPGSRRRQVSASLPEGHSLDRVLLYTSWQILGLKCRLGDLLSSHNCSYFCAGLPCLSIGLASPLNDILCGQTPHP